MKTKEMCKSRWMIALLGGTLTEEISKSCASVLNTKADYYFALNKLLSIEGGKFFANQKSLEDTISTIEKEYELLGLSNCYGDFIYLYNLLNYELKSFNNILDPITHFDNSYNFYNTIGNEDIKIGGLYVLLIFVLDQDIVLERIDEIQEINDYLAIKPDINANAYHNFILRVFKEKACKYNIFDK